MPTQNTTMTPISKLFLNHLINPHPHQWIRNHLLFSSGRPVLCSKAGTRAGSSQASWRQANRVKSELNLYVSNSQGDLDILKRRKATGPTRILPRTWQLGLPAKTQDQHRGEHHAHLQPKNTKTRVFTKASAETTMKKKRKKKNNNNKQQEQLQEQGCLLHACDHFAVKFKRTEKCW